MSEKNTIIELKDVSFAYSEGAERALDHVDLAVREGEFVGVIGPSGAGKSTLAAVMSGAIPHHFSGQLFGVTLVDGQDTCEVTLTDISRIVGSVLQDIDSQMVASVVEDEMLFGLENFGVPHDQIEDRIQQTLATVGIADLHDREIATLSGGQKQKVAIAAILALAPRVLVLDEPTAALDPASSTLVFETLRRVNELAGITVVVIEQKVALLCKYCERVLVMSEGRLAFDGEPHEVFAHARELRQMGVDSPRVARMANSLAQKGILPAGGRPCLNVPEAKELVAGLVAGARGEADARAAAPAAAPAAPANNGKPNIYSATEEQLSAALIVAQQTADRIVAEAKSNAERIRLDADNQARKVIRQALDEKQTELDEIERLKVSRENFRTEYLALIQKFSDAASANFPLITSAPSGSEAVAAAPSAAATQLQAAVNPYGTQVQAAIDDLD